MIPRWGTSRPIFIRAQPRLDQRRTGLAAERAGTPPRIQCSRSFSTSGGNSVRPCWARIQARPMDPTSAIQARCATGTGACPGFGHEPMGSSQGAESTKAGDGNRSLVAFVLERRQARIRRRVTFSASALASCSCISLMSRPLGPTYFPAWLLPLPFAVALAVTAGRISDGACGTTESIPRRRRQRRWRHRRPSHRFRPHRCSAGCHPRRCRSRPPALPPGRRRRPHHRQPRRWSSGHCRRCFGRCRRYSAPALPLLLWSPPLPPLALWVLPPRAAAAIRALVASVPRIHAAAARAGVAALIAAAWRAGAHSDRPRPGTAPLWLDALLPGGAARAGAGRDAAAVGHGPGRRRRSSSYRSRPMRPRPELLLTKERSTRTPARRWARPRRPRRTPPVRSAMPGCWSLPMGWPIRAAQEPRFRAGALVGAGRGAAVGASALGAAVTMTGMPGRCSRSDRPALVRIACALSNRRNRQNFRARARLRPEQSGFRPARSPRECRSPRRSPRYRQDYPSREPMCHRRPSPRVPPPAT